MTRWHYLDPALLWLFPLAYAAHLAEETLAGEGLRVWIARVGTGSISLPAFILVNAAGMAMFVAGVAVAARRQAFGWIAVGLATLILLNAGLHVLGTLVSQAYSPGLFTAVVLYVPLGGLTMLRAATQASSADWRTGILAGAGVQAAVGGAALSGLLA
jgi:hypothetical protein